MPKTQRLLKRYDLPEEEIERKLITALEGTSDQDLETRLFESVKDIKPGTMIIATVESVDDHTKTVVMGFGGKSEGHVPLSEFGDVLPEAGQEFEVFYEGEDAYQQTANISKRRADRLRAWERVSVKYNEGDEINGVVMRKIKGGLLVDVEGVNARQPGQPAAHPGHLRLHR